MLHSTDEPRSALPASTTTSAALLDPPPGLQSPSPASVAAPANAPAHDPQPFTLSNTTYVPYVGRDNRLTMPPTYHQPTASDDASSQAPPRLTEPYSADVSDHRRPLAARPPLDRYSPLAVTDTTDPSAFGFSARDAQAALRGEAPAPSAPSFGAPASAPVNDSALAAPSAPHDRDYLSHTAGAAASSSSDAPPRDLHAHPSREPPVSSGPFGSAYVPSHAYANAPAPTASRVFAEDPCSHDVSANLVEFPAVVHPRTSFFSSSVSGPRACPPHRGDGHGTAPAPPTSSSSRRSLEGAFASVGPVASDRPDYPPQTDDPLGDDGHNDAMLDEIDRLQHQRQADARERQSLIMERDELTAQLYRTSHRHTAPTCSGRPGHALRRSSGTVRPRAGAELSEMGREADEARTRRRLAIDTAGFPDHPAPAAATSSLDRPPSPPVPPPPRLPPPPYSGGMAPGSPPRPPAGGPLSPFPVHPSDPASSAAQLNAPAWYAPVTGSTGNPLTGNIPPWPTAVRLAPQNLAVAKLRQSQSSGSNKLCSLFSAMEQSPGKVAPTFARVLQCLADQYVSFHFLNDSRLDASTLNDETFRFFSDVCSSGICPASVATCFLECCSTFSSSADAVPEDSPLYSELLLRHVLGAIVLELAPPFAAMLEVNFNASTKLHIGDTVSSFLKRVRESAAANSISSTVVRSRIVSAVQEASSNPRVDRAVLNEVSNHLSGMMARAENLHTVLSSINTVAGVGGYLNEPIIPHAAAPVPQLVAPAGGFIAAAAVAPPVAPALVPTTPPATVLYSPPGAPGGARDPRAPRQCWDLDTILGLLDPDWPLPEFRGDRRCYFCEKVKGKTLIPWTPDTPRPTIESKRKFGHDPWHCQEVGRELKRLQASGDTRLTDALCEGVAGKPEDRKDFPTYARA